MGLTEVETESFNQNPYILRLEASNEMKSSDISNQDSMHYELLAKHFFLITDYMGGPREVKAPPHLFF